MRGYHLNHPNDRLYIQARKRRIARDRFFALARDLKNNTAAQTFADMLEEPGVNADVKSEEIDLLQLTPEI